MLQGAFLAELSAAAQAAPTAARLVVTVTSAAAAVQQVAGGGVDSSESDGSLAVVSWLQGRLTAAVLAAAVPDAGQRDLYVSVPPARTLPTC